MFGFLCIWLLVLVGLRISWKKPKHFITWDFLSALEIMYAISEISFWFQKYISQTSCIINQCLHISAGPPCIWSCSRSPGRCSRACTGTCWGTGRPGSWRQLYKIGLPGKSILRDYFKRIGLPEDIFSYWESVFPEDLLGLHSRTERLFHVCRKLRAPQNQQ